MQLFLRVETAVHVPTARTVAPGVVRRAVEAGNAVVRRVLGATTLEMTQVEWLRLQDYRVKAADAALLPSQLHPGLHLMKEVHELLLHFARQQGRDGILNTPEAWHNALLYIRTDPPLRFLNPAFEGLFLAINDAVAADVARVGLAEVSWAISRGCLRHRPTGERVEWVKMEQVGALSPALEAYFASPEYTAEVARHRDAAALWIDWSLFFGK